MRDTVFIVLLFCCPAFGATYYVAANGADTNNGTARVTPWLHSPGMPNCTSICGSTTPAAGDSIIFKGGDTWHFGNSGATPYTGLTTGNACIGYNCGLNWTWSGTVTNCNYPTTTSSCIYIGVDQTWFTGASFTRPIFNYDNPIWANSGVKDGSHNGFVTACSVDYTGRKTVELQANYLIFDNIEMVGMCWQSVPFYRAASDIDRNGDNIVIINVYIHGWTELYNPQAGGQSPYDFNIMISGGGVSANNNVIAFSVFDGSDTVCTGSGACTGGPVVYSDSYDFHNNVCRRIANCLQTPGNVHLLHDNLFEYVYESYDPADHGAVAEVYPGNGNAGNAYWYNNTIRHTDIGETFQTMTWHGAATYMFNNVFYDIGNGGNCIYVEQFDATATNFYFYNNTVDGNSCRMRISGTQQQPFNGTIFFQNNHFIGVPGNVLSGFYNINSGAVATITDNGNELFQAAATATSQGYIAANNYAPVNANGSTVGLGANLTSSCSTFSADNALCFGTSGGVGEQFASGGEIVNYPAIPIAARPSSGAWDAGAYEFLASNLPGAAPTLGIFAFGTVRINGSVRTN